ncbi:MAG: RNA-binding S4 domain-containing protein [Prevotellaceae bacterium]|jgi:ribosome-associated heat shock protein Hsp15|nr:RNA-binding S4 domain-containing protein [Prevotellaceae bacterium]
MIRLDKYLWAIRVYKTRSEAADACKAGRVKVNGMEAKPSREVREGDILAVRKLPVTYTYKIIQLVENRQPAKNVALYAENLTPEEETGKLDKKNIAVYIRRDRGAGRPTKKERREIDKLFEKLSYEE